jgi:NAD(P)-dependent dehydrogenase (short-subunit alcohol dehydrogenase family)
MTDRAAIVTGASSGIGFAIARTLAQEGYALTLNARRADPLRAAGERLRSDGFDEVQVVAGDVADEAAVQQLVSAHADRYGRLDVLVNGAGVGTVGAVEDTITRRLDLQLGVNLRAPILLCRECVPLLRVAGGEHRSALVLNLASLAGKSGQPSMSVYSATKAGVIAFTEAMNKELNGDGIRSVALAPGFVDTPMSDWVKGSVPASEMITTQDLVEAVRFLLRLSPNCLVSEIVFERPGAAL